MTDYETLSFVSRGALRAPEAARFLGLSPSTLAKMRVYGTGPRFRRLSARAIVYDVAELERWSAERPTCGSTSEYKRDESVRLSRTRTPADDE